uniref:DCC-interacting protein 13-alpha-like n=1 Tax=Styela clava TaxID=7725 RepID=UPI0019393C1F|nr:DCC-interacting protein 13-alpha-like [Styela clava]
MSLFMFLQVLIILLTSCMASIKLELADCLADSPQTRALIGVFQEDAEALTNYARGLEYAFQRIAYAQNELTAATQALAQHLREFDSQKFTLTTDNDYISSTMQQLASKIDQVSTFNAVLQTQLVENATYHSGRFVEKYLMQYQKLKAQFESQDKIHQEAMKRAAKLSKKRISESSWQESTDHLHIARKAFHETSMNYCATMNLLQARKKTGLLTPLVGYVQSQVGFFKMGAEFCQPELEEYLSKLTENLQEVEKDTVTAEQENVLLIDRIDGESTRAYIPDPPPAMDFPELPVSNKLTQISGYLFARSHGVFMNQWNQRYYFTQGGNLMQQGRDEVAGGLVMDLDGCTIVPIEADDRRYVFQITSQDGKQNVILQAESKHNCAQWVATISNISKGLYLANDPSKAAELMQAASQSPEPVSQPAATPAANVEPEVAQAQPKNERTSSQSSDFEAKHEAFKPAGMFERLKNAATSLMQPLSKNEQTGTGGSRQPSGDGDQISRDTTDSDLEAVVNSGFPVLFDLPSPASQTTQQQDAGQKPAESQDNATQEGSMSPIRENPFGGEEGDEEAPATESGNPVSDSSFRAMYVVRFIGCKQVESEIHNGYAIISDSIRSIMAARALHNIFSMNELHLVVTDGAIRLVDPATQLCRETFPIKEILQAAHHRENTRLFGFISRSTSVNTGVVNTCYAFESNSDGADVCCAIATAQVMVQSLIEHDEIERQKELESDLEEQSKLLAQANLADENESANDDTAKLEAEDLTMQDS